MPALFPRWTNAAIRATLVAAVCVGIGVPIGLMAAMRSPWGTGEGATIAQPVPFDHRLHVHAFRIDCRYCHAQVERSATAGMPPTAVCVPCHTQGWIHSSVFAPVRYSLATGKALPWNRVYRLPDFVYFNHSIHVMKGIGCESCHGRVDQMGTMYQAVPLTMEWCLGCHTSPASKLRPAAQMTTMGWRSPIPQHVLGRQLVAQYHVRRLTTCTTCHR